MKRAIAILLILFAANAIATIIEKEAKEYAPPETQSLIDSLRESLGPGLTEGITARQYRLAAEFIRLHGYDCPRADLMARFAFSEGFDVYCLGGRYIFSLANHGGKWQVTAD